MFPHPEDLHRLHQRQHAELIRNHTLERQAREAHAAHRSPHRLREIGLRVSGLVLSWRWWKGMAALFTRHTQPAGTGTTALPDCALPIITPPTFPLGPTAEALTDSAVESTRR